MTLDVLKALFAQTRTQHPVDDRWLVFADALEEYGERRLARRVSRFVRRYRRYRRAVYAYPVPVNYRTQRYRSNENIFLAIERDQIIDAIYDVLFR